MMREERNNPQQTNPTRPVASAPDAYEAKYMQGAGEVLYRDQRKIPWYLTLLLASPVLVLLAVALSLGEAALLPVALLPATSSFLLWNLFYKIRVLVSTEEVHIQYGLFGPKIPVSAIESCEAVEYDWKEFGGWGIKRSFRDGTVAYNMPGDQGKGVKIQWRDEGGKVRQVMISSGSPSALSTAIQQARQENSAATGGDAPLLYEESHTIPSDADIEIDEGIEEEELESVTVGGQRRGESF